MARRPEVEKPVLTEEDLAHLRRKLSQMSITALESYYRAAYLRCALRDGTFPQARDIQQLVQVWRELRRVRNG